MPPTPTVIEVTPIVLTDCILTIEDDDFAAAISSAIFTPTASSVVFKGLKKGSAFTGVSSATWVLAVAFAQDWVTPGSLSNYLHDNEGLSKAAVFAPQDGLGPSFAATILITPGAIGGAVDTVATATVNLGVHGKPERVAGPTP